MLMSDRLTAAAIVLGWVFYVGLMARFTFGG